MPYFAHQRVRSNGSSQKGDIPPLSEAESSTFPSTRSLVDSTPELYKALRDRTPSSGSSLSSSPSSSSSSISSSASNESNVTSTSKKSGVIKDTIKKVTHPKRKKKSRTQSQELCFEDASARRSYFSNAANRQEVAFGPSDIITTDFCYGFIEFSPSLSLRLPGGLSFDLVRYWDGQPVRFVCCERKETAGEQYDNDEPWGRIFWCITIEMDDEEDQSMRRDQEVDDID